jgi:hypothetical protein
MPFIKDYETDKFGEPPEGDDEYEKFIEALPFEFEPYPGSDRLDIAGLSGALRQLIDQVRKAGLTHFVIEYDGGNDEGFCTARSFLRGQVEVPLKDAIANVRLTPSNDAARGSFFRRLLGMRGFTGGPTPAMTPRGLVDQLTEHVAVTLLCEGFGTGPYELYGRAVLDLQTGKITDDPNAKRADNLPADGDWEPT